MLENKEETSENGPIGISAPFGWIVYASILAYGSVPNWGFVAIWAVIGIGMATLTWITRRAMIKVDNAAI